MRNIIRAFCNFILIFSAGHALAVTMPDAPDSLDQFKEVIEKVRVDNHIPAIGIALVDENGPYWIAGLGEANIEKHVKADENTLFRIGSVSKVFVGLSILKLVEEGKLDLNDKLHDIAPEITYQNPWEATNPIRIAHLLEHTTGWDALISEYGKEATDTMRLQELLMDPIRIRARTSRWVPGTRHAYSNIGPVVAAYVVEKITGKKYEEFVQEAFFNPLQMNSTTFFKTDTYLARAAITYVDNKPHEYVMPYSRPSSSINSSPKDMAQLIQFFINSGNFNNNAVLKPESIERMQAPQTTLGAKEGVTAGYGLTLQTFGNDNPNIALHGHTGGLPGAITEFAYIPELKLGYVFMINTEDGDAYGKLQHTIREYLIKHVAERQQNAIELPLKYQHLSGFYTPINPISSLARVKSDIDGIMKFSISDNRLHREPFFGGWRSSDYAANEKNLINPYTGLPSIAIVQDPLEGEVVQVDDNLYKPISAVVVYGRLAFIISLMLLSVTSVIFALIWIPQLLFKKIIDKPSIAVRGLPFFATLCLILVPLVPVLFGADVLDVARVSPTSMGLFLLSLIYPVVVAGSLFAVYRYRKVFMSRWIYWHSTLLAILHLMFVIYLINYGLIGIRLWA